MAPGGGFLSSNGGNPEPVDFVIITALEEERDALLIHLPGYRVRDKDGRDTHTYYEAAITTGRSDRAQYRVIVTCLANAGPLMALSKAAAVVTRWHPKHVLLLGIACGVRDEAALGDVLVARQVADYTLGKVRDDGTREVRWEVYQAGANLLDSALALSDTWRGTIRGTRPGDDVSRRLVGVIASGGDVISSDKIVAEYQKSWGKLIGIEMEAGGTATGLHNTTEPPEFLMVKAVSDFGKDKHEQSVQPWRAYACSVAAAFCVALLHAGPTPASPDFSRADSRSSSTFASTSPADLASGGPADMGPVRHWWSQIDILGAPYRVSLSTPKALVTAATSDLDTEPTEGTLVMDAEGKGLAHLVGDQLQVAWLDRYSGEVERWPKVRLEGYGGARLLALAMLGYSGVQIVMSTSERTFVVRVIYPGALGGHLDVKPLREKPSRDAVFVGKDIVTVAPDGRADDSDLAGWLRLDSIECVDAAATESGGLFAAVGTRDGSLSLVMTTLSDRQTESLEDPPSGVVVVRTVASPTQVLLHKDGSLTSVRYSPSSKSG